MTRTASELTVTERLELLRKPFSSRDIDWKIGSYSKERDWARALPYLKFTAVADRLDSVLGAENWKEEFLPGPAGGVVCRLFLRLDGEWIAKENGADNTDMEAVKGGLTDAFKRAAVMWGVGRYLYGYRAEWRAVDERGRLAETPMLPNEFLPEDEWSDATAQTGVTEALEGRVVEESASAEGSVATGGAETEQGATSAERGADTTPQSEQGRDADPRASASSEVVPVHAAAPTSASTGTANADADADAALLASFTEAERLRIQDIMTRAANNVSLSALKNWVQTKAQPAMSEQACQYLLNKLELFTA